MPPPSARQAAAIRGSLSARQWQDIRRAARIACSEKVVLTVHGIKISGDHRSAGNSQGNQKNAHGTGQVNSAATSTEPASEDSTMAESQATKRELREARRRAEHIPRRCADRWLSFLQRVVTGFQGWRFRRQLLDTTFVTFMRAKLSARRAARLRLRSIFWRAWTLRQFESSESWAAPLGKCSYRDGYVHGRAAALIPTLIKHGLIADGDAAANPDVDVNISDARASPGGRTTSTRKVDEAGIPATPGSARARKKRSGRR